MLLERILNCGSRDVEFLESLIGQYENLSNCYLDFDEIERIGLKTNDVNSYIYLVMYNISEIWKSDFINALQNKVKDDDKYSILAEYLEDNLEFDIYVNFIYSNYQPCIEGTYFDDYYITEYDSNKFQDDEYLYEVLKNITGYLEVILKK